MRVSAGQHLPTALATRGAVQIHRRLHGLQAHGFSKLILMCIESSGQALDQDAAHIKFVIDLKNVAGARPTDLAFMVPRGLTTSCIEIAYSNYSLVFLPPKILSCSGSEIVKHSSSEFVMAYQYSGPRILQLGQKHSVNSNWCIGMVILSDFPPFRRWIAQ